MSSPTGVEWGDIVRNWWRYDVDNRAMVQRASGETVAFLGALEGDVRVGSTGPHRLTLPAENPWGLFEYRCGAETYPLLVELRSVRYPNRWPNRYVDPPYRAVDEPVLHLTVWRVDHERSALLWCIRQQSEARVPPPYGIWYRAERAIVDAALLWPREFAAMPVADEVAVNGGWLNGAWTRDYYRRFRPDHLFRTLTPSTVGPSFGVRQFGLPLSQYSMDPPFCASQAWTETQDCGIGLHGDRHALHESMMRNDSDDTRIARTANDLSDAFGPRFGLTVLSENFFTTLLFGSAGHVNEIVPERNREPGATAPSWIVATYGYCAQGVRSAPDTGGAFRGVPIAWTDSITDGKHFLFTPDVLTGHAAHHPLASYRLWQWLHTSLAEALPLSRGFGANLSDGAPRQGDVGRVCIMGGFIGGVQALTTEIRLKLRLDADSSDTGWEEFFS